VVFHIYGSDEKGNLPETPAMSSVQRKAKIAADTVRLWTVFSWLPPLSLIYTDRLSHKNKLYAIPIKIDLHPCCAASPI
jgi:hypothetical protein